MSSVYLSGDYQAAFGISVDVGLLPLQDWLSVNLDVRVPDPSVERINVPSDPRNYWRYRMHLTLESLLRQDKLNETVRLLIGDSLRR